MAVICWLLLAGFFFFVSPLGRVHFIYYMFYIPIFSLFTIVVLCVAIRRSRSKLGQVALFITIMHLGLSSFLAVMIWGFRGM